MLTSLSYTSTAGTSLIRLLNEDGLYVEKNNILRRKDIFRHGEDIMANEVLHDEVRDTHAHEFYEIVCVLSGSGQHHVGTEVQTINENDVLLINPYIPHAYFPAPGDSLHVCNVTFTENAVSTHLDHEEVAQALSLFLRLNESRQLMRIGHLAGVSSITVMQIMREMAAEYFARDPGYQLILQGLLLTLLARIWRQSTLDHAGECSGLNEQRSRESEIWQAIFPAFRLIYEQGGAHLSVRTLADQAGWSVDHFSRMFKQATGETVQRYMRLIRIRRAAALLLTSSKPIDAIAAEVGYSDSKSFRRAFHACVGLTPDTYRRQQV